MIKKGEVTETENVSRETLAQETDGWVLVRALFRLSGYEGREVEVGEEYLQPPEAAAFMAAQGWVEIVSPVRPEDSDEWPG
jgi:hypothetical protein